MSSPFATTGIKTAILISARAEWQAVLDHYNQPPPVGISF